MQGTGLIYTLLHDSVAKYPLKTVLVQGKERISYEELGRRAGNITSWLLEHELQPGDRIAILTDQACEYIAAYFGVMAAGGIVIGLNTQTSPKTLSAVLSSSGCSMVLSQRKFKKYAGVITEQKSVQHLELDIPSLWEKKEGHSQPDFPERDLTDVAQIIYTSGTTGSPKGVMLTHQNLLFNTKSIVSYLQLTEKDRIMAVLPFFYSYGNSVMLTHIAVGGTLIVNQSFLYPNVILEQMKTEEVTGFSGVPSSFAILMNRSAVRDYSFPKLRYLTQAGAAMSPALAQKLMTVFQNAAIFIMYGQTEASARLSFLDPDRIVDKAGSIGKAIPGVTLKVCLPDGSVAPPGTIGEIVASGANIMNGYWQQPDETAKVIKNGELWTGDLAKMDDEGFLFIESRISDMIKSGSHRIGPKEIEDVIMEFPDVHEVAVVGHDDEILGEKIVAFVVPADGVEIVAKELNRHSRRNLPAFKVPHEINFMDDLPKTATGKIKKTELKK